jgi:hypothetical protein
MVRYLFDCQLGAILELVRELHHSGQRVLALLSVKRFLPECTKKTCWCFCGLDKVFMFE